MSPRLASLSLSLLITMVATGQTPKRELPEEQRSLIDTVNVVSEQLIALKKRVSELGAGNSATKGQLADLNKTVVELTARVETLVTQVKAQDGRQVGDRDQLRTVLQELTAVKVQAERTSQELAKLRTQPRADALVQPYQVDSTPWRTFAAPLAGRAAEIVAKRMSGSPGRVAIFLFGDENRKVPLTLAESALAFQGSLIDQLTVASKGRFVVLDASDLEAAIKASGKDMQRVSPFDPKATAERIRDLGLQAAIIGTFFPSNTKNKDGLTPPAVSAVVVFADGGFAHLSGSDPPSQPSSGIGRADDRLKVGLLIRDPQSPYSRDDDRGWKSLPYVYTSDENSDVMGVLFVEVPADVKLGTEAAEFKVRVRNYGRPSLFEFEYGAPGSDPIPNPQDARRQFGVVVQADGVDSFLVADGKGGWKGRMVEPGLGRKHVLTGPGTAYVKGFPEPRPVAGDGHSTRDIIGFIRGDGQADQFRFGRVDQSVAAEVTGTTHKVGVINVTIYAEAMKTDGRPPSVAKTSFIPPGPPNLGVGRGPTIPFPTMTVSPNWLPEPVMTRTIFYRRAGDIPIPAGDRRVAPVSP